MKTFALSLFVLIMVCGCATSPRAQWSARVTPTAVYSEQGIVLEGHDRLELPAAFRPPVEITVVAKTDSTNLRLAYAADQIIFNWEMGPSEFRINGGPADGLHKAGAGAIPRDKYVTIRWVVTPRHQAVYVDDELRYEHAGDYSGIDKRVSVFSARGSQVTVKSIKVKQLRITEK